jgi:hypothetical protein
MTYIPKRRTTLDFSEHVFTKTQNDLVSIYKLKIPNTGTHQVKFICSEGITAVTGDFGNWIFCREFHPNKENYCSEGYFNEKLSIASEQTYSKYDSDETEKIIDDYLDKHNQVIEGIERFKELNKLDMLSNDELLVYLENTTDKEYIFESKRHNQSIPTQDIDDIIYLLDDPEELLSDEEFEYLEDIKGYVYDELDYTYNAYRNQVGRFEDYESIPFVKSTHRWLLYVYDAFDEMCQRSES